MSGGAGPQRQGAPDATSSGQSSSSPQQLEVSFTLRRGEGGDDAPSLNQFLGPAFHAVLRRSLQAAQQRAAAQRAGAPADQEGAPAAAQPQLIEVGAIPLMQGSASAPGPGGDAARVVPMSLAQLLSGHRATLTIAGLPVPPPRGGGTASAALEAASSDSAASAAAAAAAPTAAGPPPPEISRMIDRMRRLSGAVAGSIFSDLIAGAIRPGDSGAPPASERAIERLDRESVAPAGTQCTVCLVEHSAEETCTKMPCGHCFHEECLVQWLRQHNTCPTCRHAIEATQAPRPTPLSAVLSNWHERMRAEQAAAAAAAPAAATGNPATVTQAAPVAVATRSSRGMPADAGRSTASPVPGVAAASSSSGASTSGGADGDGDGDGDSGAAETEARLQSLSVGELKRRLAALRVDFSGAIEKHELLALLRRHMPPRPAPRAPALHLQVHLEVMHLPASSLQPTDAERAGPSQPHAQGAAASAPAIGESAAAAPAAAAPPPVQQSGAERPSAERSGRTRRSSAAAAATGQPATAQPTRELRKRKRGGE